MVIARLLSLLLLPAATAPAQQFPLWLDFSGDWRISSTDEPRFADPGYDDAAWDRFPMPARRLPPVGTYWLRSRFTVPAGTDTANLALTLGSFSEVYELFLNGQRIGARGEQRISRFFVPRPMTFDVPAGVLRAGEPATLAVRLWRPRFVSPAYRSPVGVPDRGPYLLTNRVNAPPFAAEIGRAQRERLAASAAFVAEFYVCMFGLILLVWATERHRTELIWLLFMLLALAVRHGSSYRSFVQDDSGVFAVVFGPTVTLAATSIAALTVRIAGWKDRWAILLVAIPTSFHIVWNAFVYVNDTGFDGYTELRIALRGVTLLAQITGLFAAVLTVASRRPTLTRILACVLAVAMITDLTIDRPGRPSAPFRFGWEMYGFRWESQDLFAVLITILITVLVLQRLIADRREKSRLTGELEAARTVQQLLLPASTPANLEAVYLPAAEVGGDFWHVFDNRLIVAGDVSGKGLKAAMIVSLVTGALRNRRSGQPAAILAELNAVLLGSPGFVTCCIAHLDGDSVTVANAGHPSPYLNGQELDLPPGLPLGITPDANYTEITIPLTGPLTFLSDGVPEAANAKGELFGFERTAAISNKAARDIAEAARAWGQNDDITVVTVRRAVA